MEKKYKRIPFDLDLAKAITKGEKEGRVVMRNNKPIRLISFSIDDRFCPILGITDNWDGTNTAYQFTIDGGFLVTKQTNENDLFLEVPEEQAFKEGDVVMYSKFQVAIYNKDLQRVFAWTTLKGEKPRYDDTFFTPPVRLATPEERQLLIDALKKDGSDKAVEYLKYLCDDNDSISKRVLSNLEEIGKNLNTPATPDSCIDYERLRVELAKIYSVELAKIQYSTSVGFVFSELAKKSVEYADVVIAQLKKRR